LLTYVAAQWNIKTNFSAQDFRLFVVSSSRCVYQSISFLSSEQTQHFEYSKFCLLKV